MQSLPPVLNNKKGPQGLISLGAFFLYLSTSNDEDDTCDNHDHSRNRYKQFHIFLLLLSVANADDLTHTTRTGKLL